MGTFCCFQYVLHQAVGPGVATCDRYMVSELHAAAVHREIWNSWVPC